MTKPATHTAKAWRRETMTESGEPEAVLISWGSMGKKEISLETLADSAIVDRLVRDGFIEQLYKKR